ncbi:MAG: tetratricopeptide repeat protein [Elusimicrobia bacterium]|nr:tetratricopeptide repeat protein [Elusimicrobiota bacterium]
MRRLLLAAAAVVSCAAASRAAVITDSQLPEDAVSVQVSSSAQTSAAGTSEKPKTSLYSLGMEQRRNGDLQAARKTFEAMLAEDPESGGALEGLGLVTLSLKDYETARECFSKWAKKNPKSAYVWWNLSRADSALEREDDLANDLKMAAEADKRDLRVWRKLDGVMARRPSVQADGKMYKSIGIESNDISSPQRIVYAGRSGSIRGIAAVHPKVDLLMGYTLREDIQKNDTRGFTYFDVLEQTPSLGLRVRPMKRLDLEAEYGQSYFSDVESLGVGRQNFVRARVAGEWRHPWATFRARGTRLPYYLRGGFDSTFFKVLRELSAGGEIDKDLLGVNWLLKGGHTGYSDRTNLVTWGLTGMKEYGDHLLRAGFSKGYDEYTGAGDQGRSRFAGYDGWKVSYRFLREDYYRLDLGYAYYNYYDANKLKDLYGGAILWVPFARSFSLEYRGEAADYRSLQSGRRTSDWTEHWAGPHWRRMVADGWWAHLAWEHGWQRDSRGGYEGEAFLAETECYRTDRFSTQVGGRVSRNAMRDESWSLKLSARYSF